MGLRKRIAIAKRNKLPLPADAPVDTGGPRRSFIRLPAERARQLGSDQSTFIGKVLAAAFVRGFRQRKDKDPKIIVHGGR